MPDAKRRGFLIHVKTLAVLSFHFIIVSQRGRKKTCEGNKCVEYQIWPHLPQPDLGLRPPTKDRERRQAEANKAVISFQCLVSSQDTGSFQVRIFSVCWLTSEEITFSYEPRAISLLIYGYIQVSNFYQYNRASATQNIITGFVKKPRKHPPNCKSPGRQSRKSLIKLLNKAGKRLFDQNKIEHIKFLS